MSDEVYIYQGALYCEDCVGETPSDSDDESSDSNDYPKGPYPDGGGEADCPQHCDGCGEFLQNPLTDKGVQYVREAIREALVARAKTGARSARSVALEEWAPYYGIDLMKEWDDMTGKERGDYIRDNPNEFHFTSFFELLASIRGDYLAGRLAI